MFRDHSLIPSEAIRLAALGMLAEGPRRYGELAVSIRHFTSCLAGPSPELMGTSLELLRYEGLVAAADDGAPENALLSITEVGRVALKGLLTAQLRASSAEMNRLALLLKLRFLHLLSADEQRAQMALVTESLERERARLDDLRRNHATGPSPFRDWLDHDIEALDRRLKEFAGV